VALDIIKTQYKIDEKENGYADMKAVLKYNDQEFLRHLNWDEQGQRPE
tara:strand:+ start:322 stop:465 length:144 start_codon:yes stop_codon:yes gene_type:complete